MASVFLTTSRNGSHTPPSSLVGKGMGEGVGMITNQVETHLDVRIPHTQTLFVVGGGREGVGMITKQVETHLDVRLPHT